MDRPQNSLFVFANADVVVKAGRVIGYVYSESWFPKTRLSSFKKMSYLGIQLPKLKYGFSDIKAEVAVA